MSKVGDVIIDLEARDVNLSRGLDKIERRLMTFGKGAFGNFGGGGFGALLSGGMKAGGVVGGIAAAIGAANSLTGALAEANRAGIDMGLGIEDGALKFAKSLPVIGDLFAAIKSNAELATEALERFHKIQDQIDQAASGARAAGKGSGIQPGKPSIFTGLDNPAELDAALNKMEIAAKAAEGQAAGPLGEISSVRAAAEASRNAGQTSDAAAWENRARGVEEANAAIIEEARAARAAVEAFKKRYTAAAEQAREGIISQQQLDQRWAEMEVNASRINQQMEDADKAWQEEANAIERLADLELEMDREEAARKSNAQDGLKKARSGTNRTEFVALEEMARRIQMGSQKSPHEVEMEKLEHDSLTVLKEIRDKKPVAGGTFA